MMVFVSGRDSPGVATKTFVPSSRATVKVLGSETSVPSTIIPGKASSTASAISIKRSTWAASNSTTTFVGGGRSSPDFQA